MIGIGCDFQTALSALKAGYAVRRAGWNSKNQYVVADRHYPSHVEVGSMAYPVQPFFCIKNAQDQWQPGWLASQGDICALDWEVFENPLGER